MWASRDSKSRLPCDQVLSAPSQPDDLTKVTDLARSALHLQYSPHHELRLSEGVMRETNPRHVFEEIAMNQRSTTSRAQTTSSRKKRGGGGGNSENPTKARSQHYSQSAHHDESSDMSEPSPLQPSGASRRKHESRRRRTHECRRRRTHERRAPGIESFHGSFSGLRRKGEAEKRAIHTSAKAEGLIRRLTNKTAGTLADAHTQQGGLI